MSLSVGAPLGNLWERVFLQGTVRNSGKRALEMEHQSVRELC